MTSERAQMEEEWGYGMKGVDLFGFRLKGVDRHGAINWYVVLTYIQEMQQFVLQLL